MKKYLIFIFIIVFCGSVLYSQNLKVKEVKIEKGPSLIFIDSNHNDYVSLAIFVRLTQSLPGLAHLGEHLIFASNSKMKAGDLDYILESFGSTCDAYTNYDYSVYKLIVRKEYLSSVLENLSYALLTPKVTQEELDLEKSIINDEFSGKKGGAFDSIRFDLAKALYGYAYCGVPIEGEDISPYTLDDLSSFYLNNYISSNMAIIVSGDVNQKNIIDDVKKYFVQSEKKVYDVPPVVKTRNKNLYITGNKSYFGIMFSLAPTTETEEALACDVLSQLFDNLSSYEIRQKYKLKSVYIHNSGRYASPFTLIYQGDDIDFLKSVMLNTATKIENGDFDEYDLIDAKNSILSDYLGKNNKPDTVTYNTGFNYVLYDFETLCNYDKLIKKVSKADIIAMAKKYLNTYTSLVCEKQ